MKILIIVCHHRENSLTYELKNQLEKGLKQVNHQVDVLDLHHLKFNPVLEMDDDPDWSKKEQHFSAEVIQEQERLLQYDAVALVFPLWWFSMPALLKGYIDRVWNLGFAYGRNKQWNPKKCLWLGLVGSKEERYAANKLDEMVDTHFNVGIAGFCGIEKSRVKLFYQTTVENTEEINQQLIREAYQEGLDFDNW